MIGVDRFAPIASALRNRNFLIYILGSAPSALGTWIQRVAMGWLTWELTESATWLGIMGFANLFPTVFFNPIAGVLADRFDRLHIAMITQIFGLAVTTVLTGLTYSGLIGVEILLTLTILTGIAQAFYQPVRQALVHSLVRKNDLPSAIALGAVIFQSSGFIGPALAGIIIVWGGVAPAFAVNAFAFLLVLIALSQIRPTPQEPAERSAKGFRGEMMAGYRYALGHPGIGPLMLTVLVSFLFARPIMSLLPGFAEAVFTRGVEGLAWLTSAAGFGAMAGGLWLAQRGTTEGLAKIAVANLAVGALSVIAFALAWNFPVAVACLTVTGACATVHTTGVQTLIQSSADRTMLGRLLGMHTLFTMGALSFGNVAMGWLSSIFGFNIPIAVGAGLCILMYFWALSRRRIIVQALEADYRHG